MERCRPVFLFALLLFLSGCSATTSFLAEEAPRRQPTSVCHTEKHVPCASEVATPWLGPPAGQNQSKECQCAACRSHHRSEAVCGEQICGEGSDGCVEGCGQHPGYGSRANGRFSGLNGGIVRGKDNIVLDGAGWVMGIPSKLLLWNSKVDSHTVSPEVEYAIQKYLSANGLSDVKVRINQYDPVGEWKRLLANRSIHPAFKYTVGAFAVSKYTLIPGRLFGADDYNPFTNSISLYSDRASLALREGAHAKNAIGARYRGLYASSMYVPGSPIWVDTQSTREVIRYTQQIGDRKLEREAYLVLFPAFGSRLGSSATLFLDAGASQATQASLALVGHAVGRTMAFRASETPIDMVKSVYGIVKKPHEDDQPVAEQPQDQDAPIAEKDSEPQPPQNILPVHFIPVTVTYRQ